MSTLTWDHDHILYIGGELATPTDPTVTVKEHRKRIEPWLSAVFQAEHLALLLGSGFTTAIAGAASVKPFGMSPATFAAPNADKVNNHATGVAARMGRGAPNIEDQLTSALALLGGLSVLDHADAATWKTAIDNALSAFVKDVLITEGGIRAALGNPASPDGPLVQELLVSFLMSFASRAASRERLNVFTTNYDRLIERGCDLAGLRIVDRFVGAIEPEFRSSRLQIDMHYMPPGIRGEPRHLEGVVHFTKLHGSLDWRYEPPRLVREAVPFGADPASLRASKSARDSFIIYPNAAKDVQTASYPYADLFRDFSASVCQPNSVLVSYGYGFGDDHVNRIIADMLTVPSSHLVIIAWDEKPHRRVGAFLDRVGRYEQITLLLGKHFADLQQLVTNYLPKPAIDPWTIRAAELVNRRTTRASDSGEADRK